LALVTPRPLVLASTSKYRGELLGRLGVPFEQAKPDFDERAHDERWGSMPAADFALALAEGKARSLAAAHPGSLILAADQIAVLPDEGRVGVMLTKPGTQARAVEHLMRLAGRTHLLITGVVLYDAGRDEQSAVVDEQRMTMRAFGREEAEAYVREYKPVDCAGSYRIEDAGIALFERVEGLDYTGIIGLPLMATGRLLRAEGLLPADV